MGSYAYDIITANAPVAWWRGNEGSGPTLNDEIGANDATAVNTPTFGQTGLAWGDPATCIAYDTTANEHLTVTDAAALDLVDAGFTIAGSFMRRNLEGSTRHICNKTGGVSYAVYIDSTNFLVLGRSDTFGAIAYSTATFAVVNRRYDFHITKAGATRNVYVDGVNGTDLGGTTDATIVATTGTLYIAGQPSLSNCWDAWIQDFRIYDRVLSAAEVAEEHDALAYSRALAGVVTGVTDTQRGTV